MQNVSRRLPRRRRHATLLPGAGALSAVLACGPCAFVSHTTAAMLWGWIDTEPALVEITVPGRNCRSRADVVVHKTRELHPRDRTTRFGIPITAPARTVIDYACTATDEESEHAIGEAFGRKLLTERQIVAAIERAPNRAGVARVKAILGWPGGPQRTRSGGERAMLRLIRAARLPTPRANYPVAGFTADFCWPDERLIVEVDGYDFHSDRQAYERDHRRDIAHKDAGYEVLRFTGQQLRDAPVYVATVIARALDRRSRSRARG